MEKIDGHSLNGKRNGPCNGSFGNVVERRFFLVYSDDLAGSFGLSVPVNINHTFGGLKYLFYPACKFYPGFIGGSIDLCNQSLENRWPRRNFGHSYSRPVFLSNSAYRWS